MEYLRRHRQNMNDLLADLYRYKDGDEVVIPTQRHRVAYNDGIGIQSYFLDDLNFSDPGPYSYNAVNNFGHINRVSDLNIQDVRHRRKRKDDYLETESRYITYDDSHVDPHSPPLIILPLVDEARTMGESVDFSIKVRSHSPVEISWRHYDDMVMPSEKYSLRKDDNEYHLKITDLNLEDGGRWQCIAVNYYGQTETTCKLTVHNYTLEKYRAPEITQGLHNFVVSEGAEARFSCRISAHPPAQVTWYKNRKVIDNKGPYRIMQRSDDTFILTIDEVVREDIGYYMCQASNTAGSNSTEAKLAVETVEKPLNLLERDPLEKGHLKASRTSGQKSKYSCIPEFTTKLKNKTVPADSTVKLTCSVSGIPEPAIQWYRNGEKIYSSLNCCMRNNTGLVSLEIAVASHENEGQYLCEATNSEGTVSCSAQITVEGAKKTSGTNENEAPIFVETPMCSTVVIGGDAIFQCVSKGNPMPSFKWTKDGQNVDENDHVSMFVDVNGGCRLVIHNVQENDAGLYMCMAHNSMGRTKCSTRLRIVGQEEAEEHRGISGERPKGRLQKYEKVSNPDISNRMMMAGKPPFFTVMLPKLVELNEGDKLRLDCTLEGFPGLVVTWTKGVRELNYNARHRIIAYGTLHTLEIPSVLITDHGEYFVRAANVFGMIESSCLVKVNKKGRKMGDREYNKMKTPARRPLAVTDGDAPLQAPFFVKHLPYTIDVIEGADLHLDCSVKGEQQGDQTDDIDGDYHRHREGNVTTGRGEGEEETDGERRTLEPAGGPHASASEATTALSPPAFTAAAAAATPGSEEQTVKTDPSFTDKFDDTVVTEGEDAVLECKTSGDSDIRWLKDGEVIYSTERIVLIRNGCLHQLYIHECTKADQAMYTCLSSNLNQSEACVAMLSVRRRKDDVDNSYADDLLKKWETKKFGSHHVPRTRDKSYSPNRRSYDPSPERDRRFRSSSRDSDIYSAYGKYSSSSYDKYSDSGRSSGKYSSYDKPTERYSRYNQPSNYSTTSDKYSRYDKPTERYSRYDSYADKYSTTDRYSTKDRYSTDRYSTDRYSADRYSTDRYSTDRYSTDKYSANQYSVERSSRADNYSTDRYSASRYSVDRSSRADNRSTDRYSSNRYPSVERNSRTDNYSSDRYSTRRYSVERDSDSYSTNRYNRISRDNYSSERYLSPKPRSRYSSRERSSSRYDDKNYSKTASPSPEDKEKSSELLSEIKYMKADIEIRIEQADDLVIDEKAASKKIKERSKTDSVIKRTDVPDQKSLSLNNRPSSTSRPSSVERPDEALVYRAVTKPSADEIKGETIKVERKTIDRPKTVETKKEETFEKVDHKTVERPSVSETKIEENFEKLDQKTVKIPTEVLDKKEESFEKLDKQTVEKPTMIETKKEEIFERVDEKIVQMPKKLDEKREETFENLDIKTLEKPSVVETKKEETFEKLDQKTMERPSIVEMNRGKTSEKLDEKTAQMPGKPDEKKEESFEKIDLKTVEKPPIFETKKEETFEKVEEKTVKMPAKIEDKKDASQMLDTKSIDVPIKVEDKVELDEKKINVPISISESPKCDVPEKKIDDKYIEKKSEDSVKAADQVCEKNLVQQEPVEDKGQPSDVVKAKELIPESKTEKELRSNDNSNSKQPLLSFDERMVKNADDEYEIIKHPEKEVIIEEFPTFSMPPQEESIENVRRESSKLINNEAAAELVEMIKKDVDIEPMSEQRLDDKTKDIEMGEEITIQKDKIRTSSITTKGEFDVKSEGSEAKEVSLFTDTKTLEPQSKKDATEEEKLKSILGEKPTTISSKESDASKIDISAGETILRGKAIEATEKNVRNNEDILDEVFDAQSLNKSTIKSETDLPSKLEDKNDESVRKIDPELEIFAQSIAKKIIEDDLKEKLIEMKAESRDQSTSEDTGFEDEDKKSPKAVIMVDIGSDTDERDMSERKDAYTVEFPASPADRRLSLNEVQPEDDLFIRGTGSPGSPVIEELRSPFRHEDGKQGIVEEPSEENKTSSESVYEADESLSFEKKKFDFEPNNVDQDVSEGRPLDQETHQISKKEEEKAQKDEKEAVVVQEKDRNGYENFMVKESDLDMPRGTLDAEDEDTFEYTERKIDEGFLREIRAAVREMQGVSDYEDKEEISSEKDSASELVQQQQAVSSQKQHSRQSSITNQTPESRSSTSSEQVSAATGDTRSGRNLTSDDLPAEDDGVWTRKPIFSEDSLSYVSEQASLSGDSHRGLETESNRTSSLERQLSDEETFLLRQTSDESETLQQQQSSDEVNVHQTQEYEDSYKRQKQSESHNKHTSKDAGIFYTETTQDEGASPSSPRKKIAEHLTYSGPQKQEREEEYKTRGQYEEQETVQSDHQEGYHSEYVESDEESEGSDVTTRTAIIKKDSDRLSVDTADYSATATESMDDEGSDRSDSRRVKDSSPLSQDGISRQTRFRSPGIEEMLKDRQFPPIFVKDLPRLLEVSPGDYLKMHCVVRYIAQIEWKKSGEKVTRDKRRRMTSDDDGTQTLHIRPVQNEDSGIYACVAKESDGTTSQTECVVIIRGKKAA